MGAIADLRLFGAPVDDAVATARFVGGLDLDAKAQARLLRDYLKESRQRLTAEILVEARDYSFYL